MRGVRKPIVQLTVSARQSECCRIRRKTLSYEPYDNVLIEGETNVHFLPCPLFRVRIPGMTARRGSPWYLPRREGGVVHPEGQVTAPLQVSLVGWPILHPIAGLRDAVTARGIVLERHARDRNGSAAAGPPAPAPDGSMHQRHRERRRFAAKYKTLAVS